MSMDFRLPNITAKDEAGQLRQMQSFMFQLVEQLNWAMKTVEGGSGGMVGYMGKSSSSESGGMTDAEIMTTFNSLKALIIKSADIVNAYYEVINLRLKGEYVAKSDYGTFIEDTTNDIEASSTAVSQIYNNVQQIITDLGNVEHTLIEVNAHIKTGLLYYDESGVPMYGLEIGQRTEIDGVETFNKYARFTSDKLSFYDSNDNEVAYISDKKLYITHVEVTASFQLGGFIDEVRHDRSVVTRWVEGGVR